MTERERLESDLAEARRNLQDIALELGLDPRVDVYTILREIQELRWMCGYEEGE